MSASNSTPARLTIQQALAQAVQHHRAGRLSEAEALYRAILQAVPDHPDALHLLALIVAAHGRLPESLPLLQRAIALNPQFPEALASCANVLNGLQRHVEALAHVDRALAIKPEVGDAWNTHGVALQGLQRHADALLSFDRMLAQTPTHVESIYNGALALQTMGRFEEAVVRYDRAIALRSDFAEAHHNKGGALFALGRHADALASWDRAVEIRPGFAEAHNNAGAMLRDAGRLEEALARLDRALQGNARFADAWSNRGKTLRDLVRLEEALESFDQALALRPDDVDVINNRAGVLKDLRRYNDALAALERAHALAPESPEVLHNRAGTLKLLGYIDAALADYDTALRLKPDFGDALHNRAHTFAQLGRHAEAARDFAQAIAVDPKLGFAQAMLVYSKLHCCDWAGLVPALHLLEAGINAIDRSPEPFAFVVSTASPEAQLVCARRCASERFPPAVSPLWSGQRYAHDRIRIAYLSADFHDHATSQLMAELFERHDRNRFEVTGVSFGPSTANAMRSRLIAGFEHFVDVRERSDLEIAQWMRSQEFDIAVDLKGYTHAARTGIFAQRAAPIQVNYLGYPGTMGAPYYDYILADDELIPAGDEIHFTEHVVHLPGSYQVNDAQRRIDPNTPTRQAVGLPAQGFVYCCFNSSSKITPDVFAIWMRWLQQVEGSVLWLLDSSSESVHNLRREATAHGVAPERLVFAPRMPLSAHLARHRLADLFVDTLPYNAHTTASDALWAGLPVLTSTGRTFAGRVGASLLQAVGLPELITRSMADYEGLGLQLAQSPASIAALKTKLQRNRTTCSLFDSERFARNLEAAYDVMWQRAQQGAAPQGFTVQVHT
ncbi:MAG: tetratricopeptide repeat protein [Betaproteobacteria bacterium]